jgi:hypothetical protein
MNQFFKVEFVITDGKATYPPLVIKEIPVKNKIDLDIAVFNYVWNNREGYGVTKNFSVEITKSEFLYIGQ